MEGCKDRLLERVHVQNSLFNDLLNHILNLHFCRPIDRLKGWGVGGKDREKLNEYEPSILV